MYRMGIRVGGADLDHNPYTFIAALDEAGRAGYEAVEIVPDDFELIVCGRLCKDILHKLELILKDYSFALSVHVPLRLNLFDREHGKLHFEVLKRCAEICARLEAGVLVYHPGRYVDNVDFPRYGKPAWHYDTEKKNELIAHEKACLSAVAREFPDLMIAMENQRPYADYSPYSYAEFIEDLVEVIRDINRPNVRMTLDTGHLNLAAAYYGEDPLDWVRDAIPWIVHTHIHDNHGIANFYMEKDKAGMLPFGRGDEHIIPGSGTFPFHGFFSLLGNYQGVHLVEISERYLHHLKMRKAFGTVTRLIEGSGQKSAVLLNREGSAQCLSRRPPVKKTSS